MNNFIHVITTRFNVPTKVWTVTRDGQKPLSDAWLKDRFEIFRKYCLPSFKNQSNQNFIWLVFFDTQTPQIYLNEIEEIQKDFPKFQPVFVNDFDEMYKSALQTISKNFSPKTEYLISTDIDNDDLLHKNFIAEIQRLFQQKHNLVIDLIRGLQLTKTSEKTAVANDFYMIANPFISLVENISDFGTVMKDKHLSYRNYPDYTYFDAEPRFIQFIHANNLVNDTVNSKQISNIDFTDYGIDSENHFKISAFDANISNFKRKLKLLGKLLIKDKNAKS